MCDCIEALDEQLKPQNMGVAIVLSGGGNVYPLIEAVTISGRKKRKVLVPAFCPFCGKHYQERTVESTASDAIADMEIINELVRR